MIGLAVQFMTRRARAIVFLAAALLLACVITLVSRPAHADTTPPVTCAQTLVPLASGAGTTSPCWADVAPYPFGSDGHAVDPAKCSTPDGIVIGCYLGVTSFAFRSWNRGLARTAGSGSGAANNPFGLWIFNGTRWYPDPTFPGNKTCSGSTVVWAGKLDYWLIGAGGSWSGVCRFDGLDFLWEPLALPKATVVRGKALDATIAGGDAGSTGITTGTCRSWDDCWFLGTYGTIVHWNGKALSDASPAAPSRWLGTEFTSAAIRNAADGSSRGIAVGSSSFGSASRGGPLPVQPDGSPPPQIYTATPSGWAPSDVEPPGNPLPDDPYRTDLVAVDVDSAGEGWMAGNPAGWRIAASTPIGRVTADAPDPAPLVPFGTPTCVGPPPDRFTHAVGPASASTDSFLWSSIGVLPAAGGAIAGGEITPATGPSEPVLVQTDCAGNSTVMQFRVADPATPGALVPASRGSSIKALSISAANDGWAATGAGVLADGSVEPPHLYHFTDEQPPDAPAGDDLEPRPLDLQQDPPIVVYDPLPPPPPPPPPDVTTTTKTLPPAIGGIKAKLLVATKRIATTVKRGNRRVRIVRFQQKLTLKLTFSVRRQVVLGLTAFRGNKTVASSKLRRYAPPHGQILLKLTRAQWPKRFAFTTDAPTGTIVNPGPVLSGTVQLAANAKAIAGRTVASVDFQYSPAGTDGWKDIGTATARPFTVPFDTSKIADGSYDLRLVVTDSTGRVGLSPSLKTRTVQNGAPQ